MKSTKEEELIGKIKDKELQITFLKEQLEDEQRRRKMKSSLLTRVDFLSQISDGELIEFCKKTKLRDLLLKLRSAELLQGDLVFDQNIVGISLIEAGYLMLNNKPTKGIENNEKAS